MFPVPQVAAAGVGEPAAGLAAAGVGEPAAGLAADAAAELADAGVGEPAAGLAAAGLADAGVGEPAAELAPAAGLARRRQMPRGWVSVKTEKKYIAVSEGAANQYFTLTEQEFEGCELRRGSFWCTDKTPYGLSGSRPRGVNDERCVHSLFRFATGHEDSADSLKYCEFGEVGSVETLERARPRARSLYE